MFRPGTLGQPLGKKKPPLTDSQRLAMMQRLRVTLDNQELSTHARSAAERELRRLEKFKTMKHANRNRAGNAENQIVADRAFRACRGLLVSFAESSGTPQRTLAFEVATILHAFAYRGSGGLDESDPMPLLSKPSAKASKRRTKKDWGHRMYAGSRPKGFWPSTIAPFAKKPIDRLVLRDILQAQLGNEVSAETLRTAVYDAIRHGRLKKLSGDKMVWVKEG